MDEMSSEASLSDEKAQKSMIDAARLAEELRQEQDVAQMFERDRKLLEVQLKDAQQRLDAENRRFADSQKNLRKSERHIKELTYAGDEDRKNHERMQALIDQLQSKIKSYKKQIEEAEEIAALNLAKF